MNLNQAFPSPFLKADDLNGKNVTVTISEVSIEELGQGQNKEKKLCVSFVGKEKKLVCNKTNANTIAKLYGQETDEWTGKRITLVAREVEFQGEMVLSIRVSLTKPSETQRKAPVAPPDPVIEGDEGEEPPF